MRKILAALVLTGCASGPVDRVVKLNTPAKPETLVVTEGQTRYLVTGTGELRLDVRRDHRLTVAAPGFKSSEVAIESHVSGGAILSLVLLTLPILPVAPFVWFAVGNAGGFDVLEPGSPWVALVEDR